MGSSVGNLVRDIGRSDLVPLKPVKGVFNIAGNMLGADQPKAPGYTPEQWSSMSDIERQSGIKPPDYESLRDAEGNLQARYKFDPYSGEATKALKEQAFAEGTSPWAQMQLKGLEQQQGALQDVLSKQQLGAQQQAMSQLAQSGGLSSGARERIARMGARNSLMAQQQLGREAMGQKLGIGQQDLQRKQDLLGKFADQESSAQQYNLGQLTGDITKKQAFDINRYNEQMRAWAAGKSADAQRQAAMSQSGGGKK